MLQNLVWLIFLLQNIPVKCFSDRFDYIVVGGGTAGCVVAARLSEDPNVKVLLLEAGGEPTDATNIITMAPIAIALQNWHYYALSESSQTDYRKVQFWPRGRLLGGTSSLNGGLFIRANKLDFDSWVKQGAEGWSWDEVLPFYKKIENYMIKTDNASIHSNLGPIPITTSGGDDPVITSFIEAAKKTLELKYRDPNDGIQTGVSLTPLNLYQNIRQTSYTKYLKPIESRSNLIVKTSSFVEKIVFDADNKAVAVIASIGGHTRTIFVNKEVILCAGSINTPQILMLSGIGPAEHLESLNINVIKNSSVGRNLKDHFGVIDIHELSPNNLPHVLFYGTGSAFYNSQLQSLSHPDIEVMLFAFSLFYISVTVLSNPESKGYIELKSTNPYEHPKINPMHLDKNDDLIRLADGLRKASKIFKQMNLRQHIPFACRRMNETDLEFWKCVVKQSGDTFYHPVGTCKMGSENSDDSVVDTKLKVIGVRNVRIADASVFTDQISGNPVATVLMIAERVSYFIQNNL